MLWTKLTTLLAATVAFFSATVPSVNAKPVNYVNITFGKSPEIINKRDINDNNELVARGKDRGRGTGTFGRGGVFDVTFVEIQRHLSEVRQMLGQVMPLPVRKRSHTSLISSGIPSSQ
ncbi:5958_t:CDS:2 [Funneliformis geosporum]|uniref:5958_t:CDS:1 n=1 Tax=Funneliformis geosporum TaxID=1117311 RepID=A0A9W4WRR4_9GLOM|nr:5958_t:CDS:2 [Funneliformis geosporum]